MHVRKGKDLIHIEANGCVINIRENLYDYLGRQVTSIQIIEDKYMGEPIYRIRPHVHNVRVVQLKKKNKTTI